MLERALRLFEVEGIEQEQPLVEVALGVGGLGGDGPVVAAEVGEIGGGRLVGGRAGGEQGGEAEAHGQAAYDHRVLLGSAGGRGVGGRSVGARVAGGRGAGGR